MFSQLQPLPSFYHKSRQPMHRDTLELIHHFDNFIPAISLTKRVISYTDMANWLGVQETGFPFLPENSCTYFPTALSERWPHDSSVQRMWSKRIHTTCMPDPEKFLISKHFLFSPMCPFNKEGSID